MNKIAETSWKMIFEISRKLHDLGILEEQNPSDKVTLAQARVIGVVFSRAPQSVMLKEIAEELNLTPGAVSQTIDILVKEDMLERCTAEHDRRAVAIRPSEKAEKFRSHRAEFLSRHIEKFLAEVSTDDQENFLRVMTIINNKLNAERQSSANATQENLTIGKQP
ncbi:MAG: MarR family transcriptional regulator [Victivallaceae bacterium]